MRRADRRAGGQADCDRRAFLSAMVGMVFLSAGPPVRQSVQDSLPGTGPSGRLWDPARAGRPLEPVTAADNDAAIQAIEKQIRSEEHTSELQSPDHLVCRLLLEKKKKTNNPLTSI